MLSFGVFWMRRAKLPGFANNSEKNGMAWDPTKQMWHFALLMFYAVQQTSPTFFVIFLLRKRSDKPLDDIIAEFFDRNQALASEVRRRTEQCERYTQYLKKHGLYETEEDRLLAQSKALKEKWGWS